MKNKILECANKNYNGSFRFFKPKLLETLLGKGSVNIIKNEISEKLHHPTPLLIHCFVNDIKHPPVCHCGNDTKFNATTKQFMQYCSNECKWLDNENIQKKKRKTCLEKYGAINVLASDFGKEKSKTTMEEKYGVDNFTKSEEYKLIATGRKHKQTTKEKRQNTLRKKFYESLEDKYSNFKPLFSFDEYEGVKGYKQYKWLCKECNNEIFSSIDNGAPPVCPICSPVGTKHELLVRDFLDQFGVDYFYNWRGIPSKREIDVYIPSMNLGIEICGLFWHSTSRGCEKDYHLSKLEECQISGIELITIFDDEFYNKLKLTLKRIKSKIGMVKRKIYARKCKIVEIGSGKSKTFLEKYHIQGAINSSIRYGLEYNGRMVALMTFNKGRMTTGNKNENGVYELGRYCTVSNFSIVGGAGKLFKHFVKKHNPTKIYSYCDRRWNTGKMYETLGMKFVKNTDPNYYYTKDCKARLHRTRFQKHKLKEMPSYDPNLSESEIMKQEKYHKIYDCGSILFEWHP